MPRDRRFIGNHGAEPCAETKAMRPDTGLNLYERSKASDLVRQLMRHKRDHLPDGAGLGDADKELIYAEVACALSAALGRPVTVGQIRLVAANMRNGNSPRIRHSTNLTTLHHAILTEQAIAEGTSITALMRRILDQHFELPQEA
jgi:hypothetical protein